MVIQSNPQTGSTSSVRPPQAALMPRPAKPAGLAVTNRGLKTIENIPN
jgi:hypothetical protein